MKRMWIGLALLGLSGIPAGRANAQGPGESVVYETVSPGTRTVTYGERYVVRRKPFKTVIRERPTRYVTTTPPVVRETRFIQPAPVVQRQIVQPPAYLETRTIQPPPLLQERVIPGDPVVRTRYLSPYPY